MEGLPKQDSNENEVQVGDKNFTLEQNVKVVRTSGEIEHDWKFGGYGINGTILVYRDIEGTEDRLNKQPTAKQFLEWQA